MSKNDNAHSIRLIEAFMNVCGENAAAAFAVAHPLSKSADAEKKYQWACDICHALEAQVSPQEAIAIRQACRCGDGKSMAREISACLGKADSLRDGCARFSERNKYAFLEYINEQELLFGYHACVCSCIKRAPGKVPGLWCECSAGYVAAMFKQIFGDAVFVELLGSVQSGADRCAFHIRW